ncbi:acyltransferase [Calidifontibacter terrae]
MKLAQLFVEKQAGLRYRVARAGMPIKRAAFDHIGRHSVIVAPLMLQGVDRISIGDGVIMRDGAWLATEGPAGRLVVGDHCYFGHRTHLHSIDPVTIGNRVVVADNVMVTSTDHQRGDRQAVQGTGAVTIGDDVFLGQNVVVLGGVRIGDGATVAAGAVVVKDVPTGAVVGGVPARVLRGSQ